MVDVISDLKARARVLHRRATTMDADALSRVRTLEALRSLADAELAASVRRRHCLSVLARELGFDGWGHATRVLGGATEGDFGTLLYPGSPAYWNIWCASYDEAQRIRREHGGYLLAYKHQFLVVERPFIESLGLDPDDPDWDRIGRDWVRPADPAARARLYHERVRVALA